MPTPAHLREQFAPYRRASKEDPLCKLSGGALGSCDRREKVVSYAK
jgi:hypothetical protein